MLREQDGKIFGVLNDFDLAVQVDAQDPSSKQRTGTKPFMAIDRIVKEPPRHMYRHDLESFYYVIIWLTSRYENGHEIKNPPLDEWALADGVGLEKLKKSFFFDLVPNPTPTFHPLKKWTRRLHSLFGSGFIKSANWDSGHFDNETLGGVVTFETFENSLVGEIV
jgi:hypothetical protein